MARRRDGVGDDGQKGQDGAPGRVLSRVDGNTYFTQIGELGGMETLLNSGLIIAA